ncbi:MAG: energy transducer TonB [Candidatus Acidiferrum sp.]
MASVADPRHSTDTHSVRPSNTSGENTPANPRTNAVACEVPVIATGALPSENGGQRELFTEETTTALVFENGGVLRLAAKVAPGQLLFLTHKATKQEVVAQVTRKRDSQQMSSYVEVEFSEPSPGFWGIEFPKMATPAAPNVRQQAVPESARVAQSLMADEPSEPTSAPSEQEIAMLKEEVDALREQLKLMQTQTVTTNLPTLSETAGLSRPTALDPSRNLGEVPAQAPVQAQVFNEPAAKPQNATGEMSQTLPVEVSGALASANAAPPLASMSLPVGREEPPLSEEGLLPKPALDFKDAKSPNKAASRSEQKDSGTSQSAALRKDLLFAAFVLITAAAAWYQNLLPWLPQPKKLFPSAGPRIAGHLAPHALKKSTNALSDSVNSPQTNEAPIAPPSAPSSDASQSTALATTKSSARAASETAETPATVKSVADTAADAPPLEDKPEVGASSGKRSASPRSSEAAPVSEASPSDTSGIVPPKLIKSVLAVASPNALQDFSAQKGDSVTLDAIVDTSGHVKSMKALSGSAPLQKAAIEALKQYLYQPATRRGKPVPAHVTVKVKFLFEP